MLALVVSPFFAWKPSKAQSDARSNVQAASALPFLDMTVPQPRRAHDCSKFSSPWQPAFDTRTQTTLSNWIKFTAPNRIDHLLNLCYIWRYFLSVPLNVSCAPSCIHGSQDALMFSSLEALLHQGNMIWAKSNVPEMVQ